MRSLLAKAADSNDRRLVAVIIGIAAVLLLPISTGAELFTELPAGQWAYVTYAQLEASDATKRLGTQGADPLQWRTPYELALFMHRIGLLSTSRFSRITTRSIPGYDRMQTGLGIPASSTDITQPIGEKGADGSLPLPYATPVSIDELTLLLENKARQDTVNTYAPSSVVDHDGSTWRQAVGASYQIGLLGIQVQTDLAMEKQTTTAASTVTSRIMAQAPLGSNVSVNAELELVDVDRLRVLAANTGGESADTEGQTRIGVGGKVQWSEFGSLRIGYELVHIRNSSYLNFATSADAGVEYNLSERASVAAGFNVNSDSRGSKATTNLGVGYQVSRNSSLSASYQLINFSDMESQEYQANVAQAELTVKF
jgi:hypothetical protein